MLSGDSKGSKITAKLSANWWFQENFTIEEDARRVWWCEWSVYAVVFYSCFLRLSHSTIDTNRHTPYTFLQFPFRLFRIYWFFPPSCYNLFHMKRNKNQFQDVIFSDISRSISPLLGRKLSAQCHGILLEREENSVPYSTVCVTYFLSIEEKTLRI